MKLSAKRVLSGTLVFALLGTLAEFRITPATAAEATAVIVPSGAGAPVELTACILPLQVRIRNRAKREMLGFTIRMREYDSADTKLSDRYEHPHAAAVSLAPGEAGLFDITGAFYLLPDTRSVKCEITSARFAGLKIWNAGQKWPEKLYVSK